MNEKRKDLFWAVGAVVLMLVFIAILISCHH